MTDKLAEPSRRFKNLSEAAKEYAKDHKLFEKNGEGEPGEEGVEEETAPISGSKIHESKSTSLLPTSREARKGYSQKFETSAVRVNKEDVVPHVSITTIKAGGSTNPRSLKNMDIPDIKSESNINIACIEKLARNPEIRISAVSNNGDIQDVKETKLGLTVRSGSRSQYEKELKDIVSLPFHDSRRDVTQPNKISVTSQRLIESIGGLCKLEIIPVPRSPTVHHYPAVPATKTPSWTPKVETMRSNNNNAISERLLDYQEFVRLIPDTEEDFKGFHYMTQNLVYSQIDKDSMLLYDTVRDCEYEEMRVIVDSLLTHQKPEITIDQKLLPYKGRDNLTLKITRVQPSDLDEEMSSPMEIMEKPFEFGWKREMNVVPRQTKGTNKSNCEIKYISPEGLVIASLKDLNSYLKDHLSDDLSLINFSFTPYPIGVNDTKKEIINMPSKGAENNCQFLPKPVIKSKPKPAVRLSSVRRSIHTPKRYSTGEVHFLPEKRVRVGSKLESDRRMTMGMLPPKYPKYIEMGQGDRAPPIPSIPKRGRPPKQRVNEAELAQISKPGENDDDLMFQISALQFNNSLITPFDTETETESPPRGPQLPMLSPGPSAQLRPPPPLIQCKPVNTISISNIRPATTSTATTESKLPKAGKSQFAPEDGELLPCSIRCMGMMGQVPSLQCRRCLCLYHPQCIGLPPNLESPHFLCSNCESCGNGHDMERPVEVPPPPPLLRYRPIAPKIPPRQNNESFSLQMSESPHFDYRPGIDSSGFQAIGQGGMSVKRLDPVQMVRQPGRGGRGRGRGGRVLKPGGLIDISGGMTISTVTMRRGRGRPFGSRGRGVQIPQLGRIQVPPIPIKGPRPEVPLLQSFHGYTSSSDDAQSFGSFKKSKIVNKSVTTSVGPGMVPHIPGKTGSSPKPTSSAHQSPIRPEPKSVLQVTSANPNTRYIQSIIIIGGKKFVVVPRGNEASLPRRPTVVQPKLLRILPKVDVESLKSSRSDISVSSEILNLVFPYLNVPDLLVASQVNKVWHRVAEQPNYWKCVRMNNIHVFDIQKFAAFLAQHGTVDLDLREMSITPRADILGLFKSLHVVTSLKRVQIGQSTTPQELIVSNFAALLPGVQLQIL